MVEKAAEHPKKAVTAFEAVLSIDSQRYDAAVELASQYSTARRNGEVDELLTRYASLLEHSPISVDEGSFFLIQGLLNERRGDAVQRQLIRGPNSVRLPQ